MQTLLTRNALPELMSYLTEQELADLDSLILSSPSRTDDWAAWLYGKFPSIATEGVADRHVHLWEWLTALRSGVRANPLVEVWPRGGGKSSTVELGCAWVGTRLARRFALIVSGTQDQANEHVKNVGGLFERIGVERALNKYGNSRGWRQNQLRTANGFNVIAYGLDAATRGIKLDQYRPDLIIFDDIDKQDDTPHTVEKKIDAITTAIIPAGSTDCAVLVVQNLIHENGIVAQLVDGRADFLHGREVPPIEPAVLGLETEVIEEEDGRRVYRITGGQATWEGQDLGTCERQINDWGLRAFLKEAQHEVQGAGGYVFDVTKLELVNPEDVPPIISVCLAGDRAATEGGGNYTALFLTGLARNKRKFIFAVIRGQWSAERVRAALDLTFRHYRGIWPNLKLRLPQDPGQAGKEQKEQTEEKYAQFNPTLKPVKDKKSVRAADWAEDVNMGNYALVKQNLPDFLRAVRHTEDGKPMKPLLEDLSYVRWHQALKDEMRMFREDLRDQTDDQIDAGSDCHDELTDTGGTVVVSNTLGLGAKNAARR